MYREIDLSDWTLFSSRANSNNFYNEDKTKHLKLMTGLNTNSAEFEYNKATLLYEAGINTPKPLEIVTYKGKTGIIFEYIKDKKSLLRASVEDRENLEEYMSKWGVALRNLHNTSCDTNMFSDFQKDLENSLKSTTLYDEKHKAYLLNALNKIKNTNTYLMVDANPSNFIFVKDKIYIIDLNNMAYGNGFFDLGFWYSLLYGHPWFMQYLAAKNFKTDLDIFRAGWPMFFKAYLNTTDEEIINEKTKEVKIFGVLDFFVIMNTLKVPAIFNFLKRRCLKINFNNLIGKI